MPPYVPLNIDVFSAAFEGAMSAMSSPTGAAVIRPGTLTYEPYCLAAMSWAEAVDVAWGAIDIPNDVNLHCIRLVSYAYHTTHPIAPYSLPPYTSPANWALSAVATVAIAKESDTNYANAGIIPPSGGGGVRRARNVLDRPLPANLTQFNLALPNDGVANVVGDTVLAIAETTAGGTPSRNGPWVIISAVGNLATVARPPWWPAGRSRRSPAPRPAPRPSARRAAPPC